MTEVFVDSFFWLAAFNRDDPYHQQVVQTPKPPRAVTTWAVLLEVMNTLSPQRLRPLAMRFWQAVTNDPDVEVVQLDEDLLNRAVELYENRPDKSWSLTDCISFRVMEDRGITDALTGDHHFEQAGFRILIQ
ncbi:MAG TPA: PIN domain-containing protein [Gemmataceae bacterium]|nr:PIN domain-containing protein [Gemmataceae bacterium]